jgi:hypothetical protein
MYLSFVNTKQWAHGIETQKENGGNAWWITGGPHYVIAISCLGDRSPNHHALVGVDQTTGHNINKQ